MDRSHLRIVGLLGLACVALAWLATQSASGCGGVQVDVPDAGLADASTPPDAREPPDAAIERFEVTLDTYPRVDGSTSTLPLARVIACELLGLSYRWEAGRGSEGEAEIVPVADDPGEETLAQAVLERIVHERTHKAYLDLVDGSADLILVANPPSPEERAYAEERDVALHWEPVGLDALVIVVNARNHLPGLTTRQIRDIYQGDITNWRDVGGEDHEIHPYVRPVNSGSQQLFDAIVMGGEPMADWPEDRRPAFMGALIDAISTDPLAIGYSVYYWVTFQYPSTGYAVFAVDGVRPDADSIAARSYPFTSEVLVVTREDLDPATTAGEMRDWLHTPSGQAVVARSGYVPVSP